ncbi:MAG TPA: hypothetical protein VI790_03025 [Candidatus Nanoarchaeia archaeon]|nr:hypothetical protein [Candidatus Nanoarchaeia archaeon]
MKCYDLTTIDIPNWYELECIKPTVINPKTIKELREQSQKKGLIILKDPSDEVLRHALEKSLVDAVLPDRYHSHDYFHHRRTILDLVNIRLMKKHNISLLFTMRELRESHGIKRALIWGRMLFEAGICAHKSVPVMVSSGAEKEEDLVHKESLIGMAETLGLNKKVLSYVQEKVLERINQI